MIAPSGSRRISSKRRASKCETPTRVSRAAQQRREQPELGAPGPLPERAAVAAGVEGEQERRAPHDRGDHGQRRDQGVDALHVHEVVPVAQRRPEQPGAEVPVPAGRVGPEPADQVAVDPLGPGQPAGAVGGEQLEVVAALRRSARPPRPRGTRCRRSPAGPGSAIIPTRVTCKFSQRPKAVSGNPEGRGPSGPSGGRSGPCSSSGLVEGRLRRTRARSVRRVRSTRQPSENGAQVGLAVEARAARRSGPR